MPELPSALSAAFDDQGMSRSFQRGTYLFHEADKASEVYLLEEGEIEITSFTEGGHRRLVTTLTPPRMFGEFAVLGDIPRTASALALTDVKAVSLRASAFLDVIENNPDVARELLRGLARFVASHEDQIEDLLFLDLRGRVAKRVLDLAGVDGVTPAITQADLASLCGGSRENVTRTLSDLQKRGYIEKTGRRYTVLNRERLEKLSES